MKSHANKVPHLSNPLREGRPLMLLIDPSVWVRDGTATAGDFSSHELRRHPGLGSVGVRNRGVDSSENG